MREKIACALALCALLVLGGNWAAAATYKLDAEKSELVVQVYKGGFAGMLAHDHVVRATALEGWAIFDPADLSTALVEVKVPAAALRVDEPEFREKYGLGKALKADQRAHVQATMESADQLDVKSYPTLSFRSTRIEKADGEGLYRIMGNLTIHGVTRAVSFTAEVKRAADAAISGRGTFGFKQSDFGIKPYSAFLGAVRNQDEVRMHMHLVAFDSGAAEIEENLKFRLFVETLFGKRVSIFSQKLFTFDFFPLRAFASLRERVSRPSQKLFTFAPSAHPSIGTSRR